MRLAIDGGKRHGSGQVAIAVVNLDNGDWETDILPSSATSNEAEYRALIKAIQYAASEGEENVHIQSDSKLLVEQINRRWRIKEPRLLTLAMTVWNDLEVAKFKTFELVHVPREENKVADMAVNIAMDHSVIQSLRKPSV